MYNTLLALSRNIFFYTKIGLPDKFETRIYLMFLHFSIMMIIYKKKGLKFNQNDYDQLFNNIENNLRELGFGDVSVNKKMKDMNKQLYDILLKLDSNETTSFKINEKLMSYAKKDCIFLHCLPRGTEVDEKVFTSNQSKVWEQASNRVHVQKSILLYCFSKLR